MDPAALASAFIAASAGQLQLTVADKMLAIDVNSDRSAVQLIDAAQQSIDRLANVSAGVGTNFDLTV
jgi:hypothetical protein